MPEDHDCRYIPDSAVIKGGMGNIVICDDVNLNRKVAIKQITDPIDKDRLIDEIAALLKFRSKHVVEVYDLIINGDEDIKIVQEYLPGSDLFEIAGSISDETEYLKIIYQISAGILEIHKNGLIHRDIKPNNMKFDREGFLKIFDFGLSRTKGVAAVTKGFRGTFGFAAPELFSEETISFTQAIDVYAFGATAYYLVKVDLPDGLKNVPPTLEEKSSYFNSFDIDRRIIDLLNKTLSKNPSDRPNIETVYNLLSKHLLHGRHKALLVSNNKLYTLKEAGQTVRLNITGIGEVTIKYDGLDFTISDYNGEIFINNRSPDVNEILPNSCVITIGNQSRGSDRTFVTFDISHPEVTL